MDYFRIQGGTPLAGTITPMGNKNSALPLLAAAVLSDEPVTIDNVPNIGDVHTKLAQPGKEVVLERRRHIPVNPDAPRPPPLLAMRALVSSSGGVKAMSSAVSMAWAGPSRATAFTGSRGGAAAPSTRGSAADAPNAATATASTGRPWTMTARGVGNSILLAFTASAANPI